MLRGDFVLARTPDSVRALAAARGYLPATVLLVKRITALEGDTVCAVDYTITINGRHIAEQLAADHLGRLLAGLGRLSDAQPMATFFC